MNEMTLTRARRIAEDLLTHEVSAELLPSEKTILVQRVSIGLVQAYCNGLTEYAWWKDGVQYVGTCGRTLADAIADTAK